MLPYLEPNNTTGSSSSSPVSAGGSLSAGAVAGIAVCGAALLAAVAGAFVLWQRRRRQQLAYSNRLNPDLPILSLGSDGGGQVPHSPPLVPPGSPGTLSLLDVEAQGGQQGPTPESYLSTGESANAMNVFRGPGPNSARWVGARLPKG